MSRFRIYLTNGEIVDIEDHYSSVRTFLNHYEGRRFLKIPEYGIINANEIERIEKL